MLQKRIFSNFSIRLLLDRGKMSKRNSRDLLSLMDKINLFMKFNNMEKLLCSKKERSSNNKTKRVIKILLRVEGPQRHIL